MTIQLGSQRRGIALIIVLIVIVVFGILAGQFASTMKVETALARHASFSTELDWIGRAGVEHVRWVLAQQLMCAQEPFDSLSQPWAGGPGGACSNIVVEREVQIGTGKFTWEVTDLDRKFNINTADELILRGALTLVGAEAGSLTTIANSILDWRDADKNPRMSGAESEVYEQQSPAYYCKDGPIDDLSELLLIRGIAENPGIYYGSGQGSSRLYVPPSRNGTASQFEQPTYAVGLTDLFTCLSRGQINLNTVSATVLQVLPDVDENVAAAVVQARAGPDGQDATADDIPFRSPQELQQRVPGFVNPAMLSFFGVRSFVFEARVVASIAGSSREYVAVLMRDNAKTIHILNLYWK